MDKIKSILNELEFRKEKSLHHGKIEAANAFIEAIEIVKEITEVKDD